MKKIIRLALADYQRRWNKPVLILLYVLTPVVITVIMWLAFGGGSSGNDFAPLRIAVVNHDQDGLVSNFLVSALNNERAKEHITTFVVGEEEARDLINHRKVSGIIILPEGFTEDILNDRKTEITLIKNPTETIYPMIAETGLELVKDATNYLLAIFHDEIEVIREAVKKEEKINSADLVSLYDNMDDKISRIVPLFKEEKIAVEDVTEEKKETSLAIYFFAGMSFFFLFFISNAILNDMVKERNRFIIRRLFLSELKKREYYFARLISVTVFLFTIELALAVTGRLLFGITVTSLSWLLAGLLLAALVLSLCSAFIMGISKNEKQAHNYGMIFVFLFAILGGSLIPVSALPAAVQRISVISPLYYLTQSMIALSTQDMAGFYRMLTITSLIAAGLFVVAYFLNIRALKKAVG